MKLFALTFLAAALLITGCENPNGTPNRTGTGALVGGGFGAMTGALLGGGRHGVEGAIIGGALGAMTGAVVGNVMDENERERLRAQAPATYARIEQSQPLYPADIKAMVASGVPDNVIISQIQSTHSVYHLSAADIIDLHNAGVSSHVVDYMINTANGATVPPEPVVNTAPPAAPEEAIVVSPGPGYVWVGGEWVWHDRWVWAPGHWVVAPRSGAVWVGGYWVHGRGGWYHHGGHWRY